MSALAARLPLPGGAWPIAPPAAELLVSPQRARVNACAGWLFLDGSRPGTRRWCDMAVCGNRAKVRQHYAARGTRRTNSASAPSLPLPGSTR